MAKATARWAELIPLLRSELLDALVIERGKLSNYEYRTDVQLLNKLQSLKSRVGELATIAKDLPEKGGLAEWLTIVRRSTEVVDLVAKLRRLSGEIDKPDELPRENVQGDKK